MESHLLQMRGLKRGKGYSRYHPFESHLLQMRGLKQARHDGRRVIIRSHLLQMRGLKLNILIPRTLITVASFTDAWIETMISL